MAFRGLSHLSTLWAGLLKSQCTTSRVQRRGLITSLRRRGPLSLQPVLPFGLMISTRRVGSLVPPSDDDEMELKHKADITNIAKIDMKIAVAEVRISEVEDEIKKVSFVLEDIAARLAQTGAAPSEGIDLETLRTKEAQLRTEKEQLRTKEAQLRTEKQSYINILSAYSMGTPSPIARHGVKTDPDKYFTTPRLQGPASSFTQPKSAVRGLGFLPTSCRIDPTADQRISRLLHPTPDEVSRERLLPPMGEDGNLLPQQENSTPGVRQTVDKLAERFPCLLPTTASLAQLLVRDEGEGVSNANSVPDLVWRKNGCVLGIVEVKGGDTSSLLALRQAVVLGTSVAMNLLRGGLLPEQIVVPVAGLNGMTAQFGCIIMLEPSFPTFVPTSAVLDLARIDDNVLAAAHLSKASKCSESLFDLWSKATPLPRLKNDVAMAIKKDKYWVKDLQDEAFQKGPGFFSAARDEHRFDVGPGFEHMSRVLTCLYHNEKTRDIPVYPLSVHSPDVIEQHAKYTDCYSVIYDDLKKRGFRVGAPNRLTDEQQYQRFVTAFRRAVELIHQAGVIHCDLYLSNVMWKEEVRDRGVSPTMTIRLIDWDCSHLLAEREFGVDIERALKDHKPTRSATFGVEHDLLYVRVLETVAVKTDGTEDKWWRKLASDDKSQVDDAFFYFFACY